MLDIAFWRTGSLSMRIRFRSDLIVECMLVNIEQAVLAMLFSTLRWLHDELLRYLRLELIEVTDDPNNAIKTSKCVCWKLDL